jgi:hypothetical protein
VIKRLKDSLLKMSSEAPRLRAYPYEIEITKQYAFAIKEERKGYTHTTEGYIAAGIPAGTWISDGAMRWLARQEITEEIDTAEVIKDTASIYGFVLVDDEAYAFRWTNNGLVILNDVPLTHAHIMLVSLAKQYYAKSDIDYFGDLYTEVEQGGDE